MSEEVDSNSTVLLSGNAAHWPTNYRGDYRDQPARTICTHDLICWAYQIARGMAYLAKKKVMADGYHLSYIICLNGHWSLFWLQIPPNANQFKLMCVHFKFVPCGRYYTEIWPLATFYWLTTTWSKWPISDWLVRFIVREITRKRAR